MTTIVLFDLNVSLPDDAVISVLGCRPGEVLVRISTREPELFLRHVRHAAIRGGYVMHVEGGGYASVSRDTRRLEFNPVESGFVVGGHDPMALPLAEYCEGEIALVDVVLNLGDMNVTCGRERHVPGSDLWSADWTVGGISAAELVGLVLEQLAANRQLKPGAVFAPPADGARVWSAEAYSSHEFVKIHVTEGLDGVRLELDLVRPRRPQLKKSPTTRTK